MSSEVRELCNEDHRIDVNLHPVQYVVVNGVDGGEVGSGEPRRTLSAPTARCRLVDQ